MTTAPKPDLVLPLKQERNEGVLRENPDCLESAGLEVLIEDCEAYLRDNPASDEESA